MIEQPTIYIACCSARDQWQRYTHAAELAKRAELEVVSTWLGDVQDHDDGNPDDQTIRIDNSQKDLREIYSADVFWLLVPPVPLYSHGAFFEFGAAIGGMESGSIHIIASGDTKRSIFCSLVEEFPTDRLAAEWLAKHNRAGEFG